MKPKIFAQFVAEAGNYQAAAELLGVSKETVQSIMIGRRGVSKKIAERVEHATNGRLSRASVLFDDEAA